MNVPPELRCLAHGAALLADPGPTAEDSAALACGKGCRVPVERGIPRFTASESYAAGFGLQWTAHPRTQLDSATGTRISRDRLSRCLGGLDAVAGRSVLEVGCGAGRFTEVLLDAGARVVACDLSRAVEANHANFRGRAGYFVCQADLMRLPVAPESLDVVVALGVCSTSPRRRPRSPRWWRLYARADGLRWTITPFRRALAAHGASRPRSRRAPCCGTSSSACLRDRPRPRPPVSRAP
jgi:SAM-dependent methyltransferase